jgi:Eukaryotic aspartyl protease
MLLLSLLLAALAAIASTGYVVVDIQREDPLDFVQHDRRHLGQRQVAQTLDNLRSLYLANITLGTPPQKLRMHIDTGSSDLWCNSPNSSLCTTRFNKCATSGTYASTASSTYELINSNFSINYLDGTGALGDYVTDTIGIGGMTIADFQFGVGIKSSSPEGVLGVGYPINEVQAHNDGGSPYDNLPQRMVKEGLIKSNAYSEFDLLTRDWSKFEY